MPRHPEPHIRRAIRILAMVGELHKRGYQQIRVMPFMSPSGMQWRAWIGPLSLFHRNHGAIMAQSAAAWPDDEGPQALAQVARYTSGQGNQYFGWQDADKDDARSLADKFTQRFRALADAGGGSDFPYAGWYVRLLGLAEAGWLPCVMSDYNPVLFDRVPLDDMRLAEWRRSNDETPVLTMPPRGRLQEDYPG